MENIEYKGFKDVCRTCLSNCEIKINHDYVIKDIYHKLTGIQFDSNDDLPKQICLKCCEKINEIHVFGLKCKEKHFELMECLKKYKNPPIIKEELEPEEEMDIVENIKVEEQNIEFVDIKAINNLDQNNDSFPMEDSLKSNEINPKTIKGTKRVIAYKKCEKCSNLFKVKNRVHSGEQQPNKCDQCTTLKKVPKPVHSGKHDQNKSINHSTEYDQPKINSIDFKCDQCDKSYASPINLEIHKIVHSVEQNQNTAANQCIASIKRPYECNHQIDLKSGKRGPCSVHQPFKCDQCESSFAQMITLIAHKRLHAPIIDCPYKCDDCGALFALGAEFQKHKRLIHNDLT